MLNKLLKRTYHEEKGITGLETAIILIAFVVVASVFAYTVLTAGIFAAERGEEAVHAGLEGARASIVTMGGVIARSADNVSVGRLTFTVANAIGGVPINFVEPTADNNTGMAHADNSTNVVVISYIDQYQHRSDLYWSFVPLGRADEDTLLEPGEKFQITIGGTPGAGHPGGLVEALLVEDLRAGDTFTIEIKPPIGAVLTLERTTPPRIDPIVNLN